jgi:RNA polymerase sigma factor (sigma-70 family)
MGPTDGRDRGSEASRDAGRTAVLVERAQRGDERAFGEIYDEWFARVYDVSCRVVGDRSIGAEVAQETFLRAWRSLDTVRDPHVFGGWLLRIARNTALNRRRAEARTTALDTEGMAMIEGRGPSPASAPAGFRVEERVAGMDDPATAIADAEVVDLVWEAVGALAERDATVLDLGLRQGLSPAEIGEAIGLNRNAANQAVHRARRNLRTAVEARVLWREGGPACRGLARALQKAGVDAFGASAIPIAEAHAKSCDHCSERRRLRLEPAALFAALPLVVAPALLKAKVAAALAAEGVPMAGSASAPAAGSPPASPGSGPGPRPAPAPATDDTVVLSVPGGGPTGPPPTEGDAPVTRRRTLVLLAAVVVLLLAGGGIIALVRRDDPPPLVATTGASTTAPSTTSTPRSSTTTAPTTAVPTAAAPATTQPVVVPPPRPTTTVAPSTTPPTTAPPPTTTSTTTTTVPVVVTITITPSTRTAPWTVADQPRLTWSTSGAATVTVTGPGVNATNPGGDLALCLNPLATLCNPPAGTYSYTLTARDAGGAIVAERTASLVVP